ncbi:MAG: arginyltransferase [Pseudomonadota bacterium]
MRHLSSLSPQFYVTAPQTCPYLDGRVERKLFTALQGENAAELNDALSRQGFRRSQNVVYRPSCAECNACLSARIQVDTFEPTKSQRRVLRRNEDIEREGTAPWATEAHYALFRRYLDARHADGGMADMDMFEFAAMIEETPVRSRVVEYYLPEPEAPHRRRLIGVCLTDILSDGLSMVYSFFDPTLEHRSLGTFIILDHVAIAAEAGLPYVYLGYWVPGSGKMDYKSRFQPFEIYHDGTWRVVENPMAVEPNRHPLATDPIHDQVAAIVLPETDLAD